MQPHVQGVYLCIALLFAVAARTANAAVLRSSEKVAQPFFSGGLSPFPAPSPGPAPGLNGCEISFMIDNYDYTDLVKPLCEGMDSDGDLTQQTHDLAANISKLHQAAEHKPMNPIIETVEALDKDVRKIANHVVNATKTVASTLALTEIGVASRHSGSKHAFVPTTSVATPQMASCGEVRQLLKKIIRQTLEAVVLTHHHHAGLTAAAVPAPGPAPTPVISLLRGAHVSKAENAPAPAANPAATPKVESFVNFKPGPEVTDANGQVLGRTIKVMVTMTGEPGNGIHDMETMSPEAILANALETGELVDRLNQNMFEAFGVHPHLSRFLIHRKMIEQWSIQTCRKHFSKIVHRFAMAYTRRMVPQAIFNECTNFMTRFSFSDDYVVDNADRERCRKATVEFAQNYDYGLGVPVPPAAPAGPAPGPSPDLPQGLAGSPSPGIAPAPAPGFPEFESFCQNVCRLKFGGEHPTCHVEEGRQLLHHP